MNCGYKLQKCSGAVVQGRYHRFDRSPEDLDLNVVIIHLSTFESRAGGVRDEFWGQERGQANLFAISQLSNYGCVTMARKPRVNFAGAVYHVMCRGNQGQSIFKDDPDRGK